jgi:adenylate cyclase class 2
LAEIFGELNFRPMFRYEKFRTEFRRGRDQGVAELDETPIGVFLELEGPEKWIDRTARRLGFSPSDYVTKSYGSLFLEWCKARQCEPGDMTFRR